MSDYMIDLETLGNGEDGVFVNVAVVEYCPFCGKTGRVFSENVDWNDAVLCGRVLEPETVKWWLQQSSEVREKIIVPGSLLGAVMNKLKKFITEENASVWAKGAGFDINKLENAYKKRGESAPWKFWNVFDVRTVLKLSKSMGFGHKSIPFEGVAHDGVDDCKHQIKLVHESYKFLGIAKSDCCELA